MLYTPLDAAIQINEAYLRQGFSAQAYNLLGDFLLISAAVRMSSPADDNRDDTDDDYLPHGVHLSPKKKRLKLTPRKLRLPSGINGFFLSCKTVIPAAIQLPGVIDG